MSMTWQNGLKFHQETNLRDYFYRIMNSPILILKLLFQSCKLLNVWIGISNVSVDLDVRIFRGFIIFWFDQICFVAYRQFQCVDVFLSHNIWSQTLEEIFDKGLNCSMDLKIHEYLAITVIRDSWSTPQESLASHHITHDVFCVALEGSRRSTVRQNVLVGLTAILA